MYLKPETQLNSFQNYLRDKAGLDEVGLSALMDMVSYKSFQKGEIVLREGQVCEHVFFVEQGLMRMYSIGNDGKEHILQFAPENWFISDRASIFFGKASSYFIDAVEDVNVAVLDHRFYNEACMRSPAFNIYNEFLLQNHIMHLQNRINLLIGSDAMSRYLDFIELYPDVLVRVPQWMVASYLGITPESLSRIRKDLAKKHSKKA